MATRRTKRAIVGTQVPVLVERWLDIADTAMLAEARRHSLLRRPIGNTFAFEGYVTAPAHLDGETPPGRQRARISRKHGT